MSSTDSEDEVYGLVYNLTSFDEDGLDRNEGIPLAYTKETLGIDFCESKDGKEVDVSLQGTKKDVLVYTDRKRVVDDNPREEYIHRMNMGTKDAVDGARIPSTYVQKVIRPFILERRKKELEELASEQALNFEDTT